MCPCARLQFFRSSRSRNTGSVSCNSWACYTIFSQNEENPASDRKRLTALPVTSAHFLAPAAVMSMHLKVVLIWSANELTWCKPLYGKNKSLLFLNFCVTSLPNTCHSAYVKILFNSLRLILCLNLVCSFLLFNNCSVSVLKWEV